jgi:hypothetical protein
MSNYRDKKYMRLKKHHIVIGKLIDLYFSSEINAVNFIEGFNFARRQREDILYQFKNNFKTRGYAFAVQLRTWMINQNIGHEWFSARAYLTNTQK